MALISLVPGNKVAMTVLWILPGLQVVNLILFVWAAAAAAGGDDNDDGSFLYSQPIMYTLSLYTGLLGGAVYVHVHGYKCITADCDTDSSKSSNDSNSNDSSSWQSNWPFRPPPWPKGMGLLVADIAA